MLDDLDAPLSSVLGCINDTVNILEALHTALAKNAPLDYHGFLDFLQNDTIGQKEAIGLSWLRPRMEEGFETVTEFTNFLTAQNYGSFEVALKRMSDHIAYVIKSTYPNVDREYIAYLDAQRKFLAGHLNLFFPSSPIAFSEIQDGDFFDRNSMISVRDVRGGRVAEVYIQGIPRFGSKAVVRV